MSIAENKAIVRRQFEEAWNQNKIAELNEYLSEDNVHYFGNRPGPFGPNELRALIANWRGGIPDFQYHILHVVAEGDLVVLYVRFTGTHTGTFTVAGRTLTPSNRMIDETETIMSRVANGKIVESWATWDRLSFLEQLGAI